MKTLEKIREEIANLTCDCINGMVNQYAVLQIIDKYAEQEPCDDTVSRGVFEQVKWERDIAIEQLHELGYELGQKIEPCDDVFDKYGNYKYPSDVELTEPNTATSTPCEDTVSRKAAKDLFCGICMENYICYRSKDTCEDLKLFDQLPSVQPKRKGGE